ncbi:MAG: glycosyltransferase family 4 protein [Hyphomicrobiaceae bacterium]
MARQLLRALESDGSEVRLASEYRSYTREPDEDRRLSSRQTALHHATNIVRDWRAEAWIPDVWLSYHPYYKAPDWIGPAVANELSLVYMTAEASYAPRRSRDRWSAWHRESLPALQAAQCHFYMTDRDRIGLEALPRRVGQLVHLPPFIETESFAPAPVCARRTNVRRLVVVAMMRDDVKLLSYRFLAEALLLLEHLNWTIDVVGDGPARGDVVDAFSVFSNDRVTWHGLLDREGVRRVLSASDLFVWPGFNEAYGLAYLEAQACGLPVVAQSSAGVSEVVKHEQTGLLTLENDISAFAGSIDWFLANPERMQVFGKTAHAFVHEKRSLRRARHILHSTIHSIVSPLGGHRDDGLFV